MRWFEHRTDAGNNKKVRKIEVFYKDRGGQAVMAATGRFWRLMEIIGLQGIGEDGLDSFSLPEDYGLEVLADDLFCTVNELREFLDLLAEVNSIDGEAWKNEDRIYAPKLGERADTYSKKLKRIRTVNEQCSNTVRTGFEECQAKVRECSAPQSQSQVLKPPLTPPPGGNGCESDFLVWWEETPGPMKVGKEVAARDWGRLKRRGKLRPLADMLAVLRRQKESEAWQREEGRFIPLASAYLRKFRFQDESAAAREPPKRCRGCRGTGLRKAKPGEDGIGGQVRCECRGREEARGP
jgi:hypothetical protein